MLGRRDKLKAIEAEIVGLENRHVGVLRRLDSAALAAEAAVEAQRSILTAEHIDAAAARKAAIACRDTADTRAALDDAARALAADLQNARARRDAERDRRARDSVAGEIEARAERIVAAAARLDEAAASFDSAREALITVCREDAARNAIGSGPEFPLIAAAARRAGVLPRDPLAGKSVAGDAPGPDAGTVAGRIASQMRAQATAIREGAAAAVVAKPVQVVPALPIAWKPVRIVLARPASYRQANGHRVEIQPGGCDLPEPIAATALTLGVGFEPASPQGRQIAEILKAHPGARIEFDGLGGFRGDFSANSRHSRDAKPVKAALPPADLGELPDVDADGAFARAAE